MGLNLAFVCVELIYGRLAHSLALIADAGHNFGDVLSLLLAWGAIGLARRKPTRNHTYGMRRASILAALANAMILLVTIGAIAWEAIGRFSEPSGGLNAATVMTVSAVGIAVNGISAWLFTLGGGHDHDLNIRSAFVHMAADAAVSLGVVIAGAFILWTGQAWIDPAVSLIIAGLILMGTWGLLRDSVNLALDAVPAGIDADSVASYLESLPDVAGVHDLHVWGMSTTEAALTAHIVMKSPGPANEFLATTERELHHRFGIEHSTLQLELCDEAGNACKCSLVR